MRIKLIQCGDLHLDTPFSSLSDMDEVPEQRREDLKLAFSRIVEAAQTERADLLLICGDLYEHNYIRKSTIRYVCDQFKRIPEISVLMIPGNHDPAVSGSYYIDFIWPSNVHVLVDGTFYEHPDGTRVYGDVPETGSLDRSRINILMLHGTLDMPFSKDAFQPVSGPELGAYGFDLCALGHFHTRIDGAGPDKRIYNAGSPEPLGFDEEGEHGVYAVEISKEPDGESKLDADFIKLNRRRFIDIQVRITGCMTNEQVAAQAEEAMGQAGGADDLYRITFSGYPAHNFKIDTGQITELLMTRAFYIRVADQTAPEYDLEQIAEEPGLRGLFVRKMLDRALAATEQEEKALVMQALYYGLEAISEGKVWL
jgi:exonuclease SbcD